MEKVWVEEGYGNKGLMQIMTDRKKLELKFWFGNYMVFSTNSFQELFSLLERLTLSTGVGLSIFDYFWNV